MKFTNFKFFLENIYKTKTDSKRYAHPGSTPQTRGSADPTGQTLRVSAATDRSKTRRRRGLRRGQGHQRIPRRETNRTVPLSMPIEYRRQLVVEHGGHGGAARRGLASFDW